MSQTPLTKKLGIKPKHSILVINAPEGYIAGLGDLPDGARISENTGGVFDVVQLFVKDKAALDSNVKSAIQAMKPGGLLWIVYPKQTSKIKSDLNRDRTWKAMEPTGLQPVTLVAIDDTWSALRFRPASEIKSRK